MGQKSNLLTLRAANLQTNLLTDNSKLFIYGFLFLNFFEKLLRKKNVLLVNKELNFEANKGFLNCSVFFKSAKLLDYQQIKETSAFISSSYLQALITRYFSLFTNNVIYISFTNLNTDVNPKAVRFYYHKIKKFLNFRYVGNGIVPHIDLLPGENPPDVEECICLVNIGDFPITTCFWEFDGSIKIKTEEQNKYSEIYERLNEKKRFSLSEILHMCYNEYNFDYVTIIDFACRCNEDGTCNIDCPSSIDELKEGQEVMKIYKEKNLGGKKKRRQTKRNEQKKRKTKRKHR
jgi:hypothetical protein